MEVNRINNVLKLLQANGCRHSHLHQFNAIHFRSTRPYVCVIITEGDRLFAPEHNLQHTYIFILKTHSQYSLKNFG